MNRSHAPVPIAKRIGTGYNMALYKGGTEEQKGGRKS